MALAKAIPEPRLYARVLGAQWMQLDERVRRFHDDGSGRPRRGTFCIRRGRGVLARIAAVLFGFPRAGEAVATRLVVTAETTAAGACETWHRTFGERDFITRQWATADGLLGERHGCVELRLRLRAEDGALAFASTRTAFALGPLRLPLPRLFAPRVEARIAASDHGMQVRVALTAPLAGPMLEYEGGLEDAR